VLCVEESIHTIGERRYTSRKRDISALLNVIRNFLHSFIVISVRANEKNEFMKIQTFFSVPGVFLACFSVVHTLMVVQIGSFLKQFNRFSPLCRKIL
jgi:hypothetical protein